MIKEKYLLATTEPEGGTATNTIEPSAPVTEPTQGEPEGATTNEPALPEKYNIDGEEFSIEEIREWRKSGLRQSDYTRKTQEVAKQRKEAEEALEIYNYLMSNQELVQKLIEYDTSNPKANDVKAKLDPVQKQIQDLQTKLAMKDIDAELKEILGKDKLVSDVDILEIATKNNCDVKTAYNIWRGSNIDKIMAEREKELTAKIKSEIEKNQTVTKTLINSSDVTTNVKDYGLTDTEKAFALKLGMTEEEYAIYKNPNYKMN